MQRWSRDEIVDRVVALLGDERFRDEAVQLAADLPESLSREASDRAVGAIDHAIQVAHGIISQDQL